MSPLDGIYWVFPGYLVFWLLSFAALGVFAFRLYQLYRILSVGKKEKTTGHILKRMANALAQVVGQIQQLKNISLKDRANLGHIFMAWGFMIFVGYYLLYIIIGEGLGLSEVMEGNKFFVYYSWVMNFAAPFVMIGALWGILRRYVARPARLKGEQTLEALVILITVFIHPLSHLLKEASAIALGHFPIELGLSAPPVSIALSQVLGNLSLESLEFAYVGFFWLHWGTVLFVLVFIAYSRYLHMVIAPINILLKSNRPKGALKAIDFEKTENFGVDKIADFSQKQLLDLYACVACGRCQDNCPAYLSGKELNPKKMILDFKKHLLGKNQGHSLIGEVISEDAVWACTTCRACQEQCAVANTHIDKIIGMRRNLALEKTELPDTVKNALESMEKRSHPWQGTKFSRSDWLKDLNVKILSSGDKDVDTLLWAGCTAALNELNMKSLVSLVKILNKANVNFGILGEDELCCGDPARRLGNEYLFQELAKKNIEILQSRGIKKIITVCPHCFNTLKNEYPDFGGNFEVLHYAEFIANLVKRGAIKFTKAINKKAVYHDPCYLGRYNDIFKSPREILRAIPGLKIVEAKRSRKNSFCCGGGGGRMWLEEDPKNRINQMRAQELLGTKADIIITACPWCLQMLDDGLRSKSEKGDVEIMDLLELLEKAT